MTEQNNEINSTEASPKRQEPENVTNKPVYKKPVLRKYGQIDRITFSL